MLQITRIGPSSILYRSSLRPCLPTATNQFRFYSFESGRKPKSAPSLNSDSDQLSPTNNNETSDSKPIVISGRGRRLNHRSAHSNPSNQPSSTPKLLLPFKPLSANHLAHLSPTTLFLDLFFSLQRPLLEVELSPTQRRSITAEDKHSKLGPQSHPELELSLEEEDQVDDVYSQINFDSPSDPAFKQPRLSSASPPPEENELDDQAWPTSDPYRSFLITEPDGVHPAWPDALKRYLAASQAFLPPPLPKQNGEELNPSLEILTAHHPSPTCAPEECQASLQTELETRFDHDRKRALDFLAPYGLTTSPKSTTDLGHNHHQNQSGTSDDHTRLNNTENSFQPGLSQDSLSLTIQAARFLHSVMMANRWPEAASWDAIESKLTAAEQAYSKDASTTTTQDDDSLPEKNSTLNSTLFPPIRGLERPINSGRRNRSSHNSIQWINVHTEMDKSVGRPRHVISLNTDQLKEIIKYSHKILSQKIGIDSIPRSILQNLQRFGDFLIHKNLINNLNHRSNSTNDLLKNSTDLNFSKESQDSTSFPPSSIPIIIIDQSNSSSKVHDGSSENPHEIVNLDSVFRKKKRKMKVHKYKKRRKARNTLKKRQGK